MSICEATVEISYPFGVLKKYGVRIFHLFSDNFSVRVAVAFLIASHVIVVNQCLGWCNRKTPTGGSGFRVELAGVEPASRQGDHMLSTCLSCLDCRE